MQVRWLRKALRSLMQAHGFVAPENPEATIQLIQIRRKTLTP